MALKCSSRSRLSSFMVMDVMQKAAQIEQLNHDVMHLEVGQPSTGAPAAACRAIVDALDDPSAHGYTLALGIDPLRKGIARHYERAYGLQVSPENVIVTVGSSLGFVMAFLTCFENGDRIAMTNPGYSAYRNLMLSVGLEVVDLPAGAAQNWVPRVEDLAAMDPKPEGLILASPSNPTGVVLSADELAAIARWCHDNDVRLISDEIYHGISFDVDCATALGSSSSAIIVNSFSKYFSMTGHRVGWMIVPDDLIDPMERLAQNAVISVPTLSQIAATAAITDDHALNELEGYVARYRTNRDVLLDGLPASFLGNVAPAQGAFYIYADTSGISANSIELADRLLKEAHVATTPGADFDPVDGHLALRLSFAGSTDDMKEAARRITAWVRDYTRRA
ncbi:MAG: aminotransferase class I/II-fold pyridoxal phosphate-dependent enzyme [Alphaproteobacteria bacterium]|nr:aminotransferase class I/II-fold pyridoxal phosphate-dependent enzyme [Alphaproteobacteria bacterium]